MKVTVTPETGLPYWSVTVATSGLVKAVATVAVWPEPEVAAMVLAARRRWSQRSSPCGAGGPGHDVVGPRRGVGREGVRGGLAVGRWSPRWPRW